MKLIDYSVVRPSAHIGSDISSGNFCLISIAGTRAPAVMAVTPLALWSSYHSVNHSIWRAVSSFTAYPLFFVVVVVEKSEKHDRKRPLRSGGLTSITGTVKYFFQWLRAGLE